MPGYEIYLTKSAEVAGLIAKGLLSEGKAQSVGHGAVNENVDRIPAIYHEQGYFYAIAEYHDIEQPIYKITFA